MSILEWWSIKSLHDKHLKYVKIAIISLISANLPVPGDIAAFSFTMAFTAKNTAIYHCKYLKLKSLCLTITLIIYNFKENYLKLKHVRSLALCLPAKCQFDKSRAWKTLHADRDNRCIMAALSHLRDFIFLFRYFNWRLSGTRHLVVFDLRLGSFNIASRRTIIHRLTSALEMTQKVNSD